MGHNQPSSSLQDIKGGYSTANSDWPYFQILDQIVPLMRKEKIEKLSPGVDERDIEGLPSPLTSTTPDPDSIVMPGVKETTTTTTTTGSEKCKVEPADAMSEPPRKRGRCVGIVVAESVICITYFSCLFHVVPVSSKATCSSQCIPAHEKIEIL